METLPLEVQESSLGLGDELGSGGQGTVFRLTEYLPLGDCKPLVYKKYNDHTLRDSCIEIPALRSLITMPYAMDETSRELVDRRMVWPLQMVIDGGKPKGVIMREIDSSFFLEIRTRSGLTKREDRNSQWLVVSEAQCQNSSVSFPTTEERLRVCTDLAELLACLHQEGLGIVFGDLNPMNVLYRNSENDSVMMIDCDAVRRVGSAPIVAQRDYDDWAAPEKGHSVDTDVYKFALFVLCSMNPRKYAVAYRSFTQMQERLHHLGSLADELGEMIRMSLGDRGDRPSMTEWFEVLRARGASRPTFHPWSLSEARTRMPPPPSTDDMSTGAGIDAGAQPLKSSNTRFDVSDDISAQSPSTLGSDGVRGNSESGDLVGVAGYRSFVAPARSENEENEAVDAGGGVEDDDDA